MKKHIFVVGYKIIGFCQVRYFDVHIVCESLELIEVNELILDACRSHYNATHGLLLQSVEVEITLLSFITSFNEDENSKTKAVKIIFKNEPESADGTAIPDSVVFSDHSIPLKTK